MTHTFAREELDGTVRSYNVYDFWDMANKLTPISIDLTDIIACINKYINNFTSEDWQRVIEADLSYPIIINDLSGILDGCHRTVKAMLLGHDTIMAVRINELPEATRIWDNWKDYDANP